MTEKELADQLRLRQYKAKLVNKSLVNMLSDAAIIDTYITCNECGEKQVDKEDLRTAIRVAKDAEHFFDICDGLANAHHKRKQQAKPPIKLSKKMQKRVDRIEKLIVGAYYDEEKNPCPKDENTEDELYKEIEEILDRHQELLLLEWAERLPAVQEDLLESIVYDLGYSFEYYLINEKTEEVTAVIGIPFGFMLFIQLENCEETLPNDLPKTVNKMTESKLLRKILNVGNNPSVGFDGSLYNVDNSAWNEPSTVRDYVKNWHYCFCQNLLPPCFSLFKPNNKKLSFTKTEKKEDSIFFLLRVVCGNIFMDDSEDYDIFENKLNEEAIKELEQTIKNEMIDNGIKVKDVNIPPIILPLSSITETAKDIYQNMDNWIKIANRQEQHNDN